MARETQSRASEGSAYGGRRYAAGLVRYDAQRRRVWICGRRLHHGLTGALLTVAGFALMAHDWRDRSIWFRLGP